MCVSPVYLSTLRGISCVFPLLIFLNIFLNDLVQNLETIKVTDENWIQVALTSSIIVFSYKY